MGFDFAKYIEEKIEPHRSRPRAMTDAMPHEIASAVKGRQAPQNADSRGEHPQSFCTRNSHTPAGPAEVEITLRHVSREWIFGLDWSGRVKKGH